MINLSEKLKKNWQNVWGRFVDYLADDFLLATASLGLTEKDIFPEREESLVRLAEKALLEWEQAKSIFNEAVDPDLIDHAIFTMEAAERKYVYLLRKAQKEKIVDESLYGIQYDRQEENYA